MPNTTNLSKHLNRGDTMNAIIYVRGHNQEMQEIFCRLYAKEKGYKVKFVTTDIEAVNNCDFLLIASHSRISRDKFKYYEIMNDLKAKGIKVVSVGSQDNADEHLSFTMDLLR